MPDFTYHCLWYMTGSWTAQLVQVVHDAAGITLTFFDAAGAVQTTWSFPSHEPAYKRWLFWALQVRAGKGQLLPGKVAAYTVRLPDEVVSLTPVVSEP